MLFWWHKGQNQVWLFISRRSWNITPPSKDRTQLMLWRCMVSRWQTLRSFCCLLNISIIQIRELASFVTSKLRSESLSGNCTQLNTMTASNNRDHRTRSLLFLVRNTYTFVVCSSRTSRMFFTHIVQSTPRRLGGCNIKSWNFALTVWIFREAGVSNSNRSEGQMRTYKETRGPRYD